MVRFRRRKVNVMRVASKLVGTILGLYIAGYLVNTFGSVMNGTASSFYSGLRLIGWSVGTRTRCHQMTPVTGWTTCIYDTSSSGILAIVGLIALASVVFEFVSVQL